jgi:amino acid adenylation domain-containing protein
MPDLHGHVPQLHDFLEHSARQWPDKEALVCGTRRATYAQLDQAANALAHHLVAMGVVRGDRVMVFSENTVETVVSFWGALKANATVCVVNPLTKRDKLDYLVADCQPAAFITEASLLPVFSHWRDAPPQLRTMVVAGKGADDACAGLPSVMSWDVALAGQNGTLPPHRQGIDQDLATIIYTSGSTGRPKGVMLTHRNMLTAAASISSLLQLQHDEVIFSVLPLAFNYGLYQMIMTFREGGRLVLERSFAFPAHMISRMKQEGATGFPGVPTMFALLAQLPSLQAGACPSLRFITNTAANLPRKHIEMLQRAFGTARIYSMYGLTECKRCTYLPAEDIDRKPDSVGIAIPNTEVWLVDEGGQRLGPGQTGELVVRGGTVMKGYWNKPEETAKRLKPGPLPGEWVLHTGDQCRMDDDGYVYFLSRMDDIIKSRGEKVAPREVENALMNVHGVREAAVVGVPDDILGQSIKAFVVLDPGATLTAQQLQLACRQQLENYMVPHSVVFLDELPKTETGKITKTGLC